MRRRVRVERAVGDHGYGSGWVVLGLSGIIVGQADRWTSAYGFALAYARAIGRVA